MSVKRSALTAAAMLVLFGGTVFAQQAKPNVEVDTGKGKVAVDVNANRNQNPNDTRGMIHRASEIHGMAVYNAADKELGTIKDIVIDVRTGEVRYAALSYGGVLGIGDKLFAVPWYAFEHRHNTSSGKHNLVFNVDEQTLKNAPGFDKNSWPNFGDEKFRDELEKHYGKYRNNRDGAANNRDGGANVQVRAGGVAVDVNGNRPAGGANDITKRSSEIIGMKVRNPANKDLGSVNDLMIDMNAGKVRYAALSYGGFLGLGNKLFAVPWTSFGFQQDANSKAHHLTLAVDEEQLKNAPGYDKDKWPNLADPTFGKDVDTYYQKSQRN